MMPVPTKPTRARGERSGERGGCAMLDSVDEPERIVQPQSAGLAVAAATIAAAIRGSGTT
jgi:hypothetical protein